MAASPLEEMVLIFALRLYKQLARQNGHRGNIFYSPFSISAALSMLLAGARNSTAKELSALLNVSSDKIHDQFSSLLSQLHDFTDNVKLHIANRIYVEERIPVLDSYLSFIQGSYKATIEFVDFRNDCENSRERINAWVKDVTESKIIGLLPMGSVNVYSTMILVNAIYMKGFWKSPFHRTDTHRSYFHSDSNNKKEIDMMYQKRAYKMYRDEELRIAALELPYRGNSASMIVLLPDDVDGLSDLEERLTAPKLENVLTNLRSSIEVELYLPKFKLEQAIELKGVLQALGVKDLFTSEADFSAITERKNVAASDLFHKAFLQVDERGTEAAAATAVTMVDGIMPRVQTYNFVVDRPFLFLIRSHHPDVVLFMGSVREI